MTAKPILSEPGPASSWRARLDAGFYLRLGLGLALLAFIVSRLPLTDLTESLSAVRKHWGWFAAGILATGLGLLGAMLRWQLLLHAQDLRPGFRRVFHIFFAAQFFNAFFPGAVGGDLIRAVYAAREHPADRLRAVMSVAADRLLGLLTLIGFAAVLVLCQPDIFLHGSPVLRWAGRFMLALAVVSLAGPWLLFRNHLFERHARLRRFAEHRHAGRLLREAYDALYFFRRHKETALAGLLLSLVSVLGLNLACWCLARSVEGTISLAECFTLFPMVTVIASIPLTPGALGVREGLFQTLFGAAGMQPADAVILSLLVYLCGTLWSLAGAYSFIAHRMKS